MHPSRRAKRESGFTLIEIMLVIAILLGVAVLEMRRDSARANEAAAVAVGKQIAVVGLAVDQYMTKRIDTLQSMSDPACAPAGDYCSLTIAALVANGYLPADFNNSVRFGGGYQIRIQRVAPPAPAQAGVVCAAVNPAPFGCPVPYPGGAVPLWQWGLRGLVFTDNAWTDGGTKINWALLGSAAKQAGPLGGVTQGGVATGLFAGWTASAGYGPGLADGQLVYATGSQVNLWSQFVRRDGTLPMTGSLDMGSFNLMNMRDMYINGPPTNPRNKNISSLMPNWVFKGAYSLDESATPPQNFVPTPVCSDGGDPKIKVLMQVMKDTRTQFSNQTSPGALTPTDPSNQAEAQGLTSNNKAQHALVSWAETVAGGWIVHFQDRFNQDDSNGNATVVKGAGLAELYCHYPNK